MNVKGMTLRLKQDTREMLRAEAERARYGSMSSIADDILNHELKRRGHHTSDDLDRVVAAAREQV
jgi:hypothetical protein